MVLAASGQLNGMAWLTAIWSLHYGNGLGSCSLEYKKRTGIGYHIGDAYWITDEKRRVRHHQIGYWLLA